MGEGTKIKYKLLFANTKYPKMFWGLFSLKKSFGRSYVDLYTDLVWFMAFKTLNYNVYFEKIPLNFKILY